MRLIALVIPLILAGCATAVPVARSFPAAPDELMDNCLPFEEVPEGTTKLSEVMQVVSRNYASAHECRSKAEGWQDWYRRQKQNFEAAN